MKRQHSSNLIIMLYMFLGIYFGCSSNNFILKKQSISLLKSFICLTSPCLSTALLREADYHRATLDLHVQLSFNTSSASSFTSLLHTGQSYFSANFLNRTVQKTALNGSTQGNTFVSLVYISCDSILRDNLNELLKKIY